MAISTFGADENLRGHNNLLLTSFLSLPREVLKQIVCYRSMNLYCTTSPHADGLHVVAVIQSLCGHGELWREWIVLKGKNQCLSSTISIKDAEQVNKGAWNHLCWITVQAISWRINQWQYILLCHCCHNAVFQLPTSNCVITPNGLTHIYLIVEEWLHKVCNKTFAQKPFVMTWFCAIVQWSSSSSILSHHTVTLSTTVPCHQLKCTWRSCSCLSIWLHWENLLFLALQSLPWPQCY